MAQGLPALVESPLGDIVIGQGKDNAYGYVWMRDGSPVPLETEGWVLKAQIRSRPGAPVWLSLTSENPDADGSVITINDDGEIVVYIDHSTTEDPAWNSGARVADGGMWDLEAYRADPESKERLVMGTVTLSPDVTREGAQNG